MIKEDRHIRRRLAVLMLWLMVATGALLADGEAGQIMLRTDTLGTYVKQFVYLSRLVADDSLRATTDGNGTMIAVTGAPGMTAARLHSRYATFHTRTVEAINAMTKEQLGDEYVDAKDDLPEPLAGVILRQISMDYDSLPDGSNTTLASAFAFCTDSSYEYSAGLTGSAEGCPAYDCLRSQPAPGWYYMRISQPGNMIIHINSTPGHYDVDFCCWGPFAGPVTDPCQLTQAKVVDCSYSTSWTEDCDIYNAQVGDYYILLITNYSQQTTNIEFSKTPGSGTAETDCGIVQSVNLIVDVSIPGSGTTTGTGTYNAGRFVTCTATPYTGYSFKYWLHNDTIISTSSTFVYITSALYPMDTLIAVIVPDSFPIPIFALSLSGQCIDTVDVTNGSYVSVDGVTPAEPFRQCDFFIWDWGDGTTSTLENPAGHSYRYSGTYTITLTAGLTNGNITDTMSLQVTVRGEVGDSIADTTCVNHPYLFYGQTLTSSGRYVAYTVQENCTVTHILSLTVLPTYFFEDSVSICPGQTYVFHNRGLNRSGIYYDSLHTRVGGCDSVYKLKLTVQPTYHFVEYDTACLSSQYVWRSRYITRGGTHYDSLKSVNGCDSVYELRLKGGFDFYNVKYDTIVGNAAYLWHNNVITEDGTYFDSHVTDVGCDSIYQLVLTRYKTYVVEMQINICEGDSFIYRGKWVKFPGVYYDTLLTCHGYDSVLKYVVNVHPVYDFYDTVTICTGQSYYFRGQTVNHAGDYYIRYQTVAGCDSTYHLHLILAPQYFEIVTDTVCSNTVYHWHGMSFTQSGIYRDSLKSTDACDSLFELRLTMLDNVITTVNRTLCTGSAYHFNGQVLTQPGVYVDSTNKNRYGCDSIVRLVLSFDNDIWITDTVNICHGDTMMFNNQPATVAGSYYSNVVTPSGCDSTREMVLTVNPKYNTAIDTTICANDIFIFGDEQINTPGTYRKLFKSRCGCDSIVTMNVTVIPVKHTILNRVICKQEYYVAPDGGHLTAGGVYYYTLVSAEGCDSVLQINLNVSSTIEVYDTVHICTGSSYHFRGHKYNYEGEYILNLPSTEGCDTVYFLSLRVHQTPSVVFKDTVCDAQPYTFGGRMLTRTGIYYDTTSTIYGCDSITKLYLYSYDSIMVNDEVTICEKDTFFWHNRHYTYAGTYHDTIPDDNSHCNIYCTLTLHTVRETRTVSANGAVNGVTMCGDDRTYTIFPLFQGETPTRYSVTYDGVNIPISNNKKDSLFNGVSIELPIPTDIEGNPVRPGTYRVQLDLNNEYCSNSPYGVLYDLTVNYPSSVIEQHFNDMVSVLNAQFNGGYHFTAFEWYVNGSLVYNQVSPNLYYPALAVADEVYVKLTRKDENYSVASCPITIVDMPDAMQYPIAIPKTYMSKDHRKAFVVSDENGWYELMNVSGITVLRGELNGEGETEIDMPKAAGYYILVIHTEHYPRKVFKLVSW